MLPVLLTLLPEQFLSSITISNHYKGETFLGLEK